MHIRLEVEVLFDEHLGNEKELQAVEGEDRAHRLHEELLRDLAAAKLEGLGRGLRKRNARRGELRRRRDIRRRARCEEHGERDEDAGH